MLAPAPSSRQGLSSNFIKFKFIHQSCQAQYAVVHKTHNGHLASIGVVAQRIGRSTGNQEVAGSTPGLGTAALRLWASCLHPRAPVN